MSCATSLQEIWAEDLNKLPESELRWIWDGYLVPGYVTLLTSQWKSGKTTLVSLLLARRQQGGSLAGRPVSMGKTVVISEENQGHWQTRNRQLGFGPSTCFFCRPFLTRPSQDQWLGLLDRLVEMRQRYEVDLVVVDSLGSFLPGRSENQAALMLESLLPLLRLTREGLAVLLVHHPRKGKTVQGQAARGSGALAAFTDILLEMNYLDSLNSCDRRRCLTGFSRFAQTPPRLLLELNASATDYHCLVDHGDGDFHDNWDYLRLVLEDADWKLTRQEILRDWPADFPRPSLVSLWRWLEKASTAGLVAHDGDGRKKSPFRYWLPHKHDQWRKDPLFPLFHPEEAYLMPPR